MSVIYLKDFFCNKLPEKKSEQVSYNCGKFSVRYETFPNMPPENSFGLYSWKSSHQSISANFYKDDILIFSKEFKCSPSIIIHGDGKTETGTFFTFNDNLKAIRIFDMTNKLIKVENLGLDCFVEMKRVNDTYAIVVTEECCTYDPSTGLVNLDIFFGLKKSDIKRPYSDSRVHVPLTKNQQNKFTLNPMIATEKGFIVFNRYGLDVTYQFTEENLVLYDDVFHGRVNFYENSENVDVLDILNVPDNTMSDNDSIVLTMDNLNEEQKNNIFDKINKTYELLNQKQNIQQTFAIIKPDAIEKNYKDNIIMAIKKNNFKIVDSLDIIFSSEMVDEFYAEHVGKEFYPDLKKFMMSGLSNILILEADDCVKYWRRLIGPTNVCTARRHYPFTLRAIYGDDLDNSKNACHGSDSVESANREINFFNKIKNAIATTTFVV